VRHSPETRAKISAALTGRKRPPSVGEKVRQKLQLQPPEDEVRFMARIYRRMGLNRVGELTGYSAPVVRRVLEQAGVTIRPPAFQRGPKDAAHG
jgi:hypothetical protein